MTEAIEPTGKTQRELNARLLVATLAATIIVLPGAYFWHSAQVKAQANSLFEHAEDLEQKGQLVDASAYLFRYTSLRPEDPEGHSRLAVVFDRSAKPSQQPQSVQLYSRAVGLSPDRIDLRLRLGELLLEQGRYQQAVETIKQLKFYERISEFAKPDKNRKPTDNPKESPKNFDADERRAARILANSKYGHSRSGKVSLDEAVRFYEAAVELNAADVKLASQLALIYRLESRPARETEADNHMNGMVQAQGNSIPNLIQALLARYAYRTQFRLEGADGDLDQALDLTAQLDRSAIDIRLELIAGDRAAGARNNWEDAAKYYGKAIEVAAKDPRGYLGLGQCHLDQKEYKQAIDVLLNGIEKIGDDDLLLTERLVNLLIDQGHVDDAAKQLDRMEKRVARLKPLRTSAEATSLQNAVEVLRAKWWSSQGNYFRAIQLLEPVFLAHDGTKDTLADSTRQVQVGALLANYFGNVGEWDRAAAYYDRVVALQPQSAELHLAAAGARMLAGQPKKACESYRLGGAQAEAASPEIQAAFARALFQDQIQLPPSERNWAEFKTILIGLKKSEQAAEKAQKPRENAWQTGLLEAAYEFEVARAAPNDKDSPARYELALKRLNGDEGVEKKFPDVTPLWRTLVVTYEQLGQPADADRALARLQQLDGDSVRVALTRSELLTHRKLDAEAEQVIRAALESVPVPQRNDLKYRLSQLHIAKGQLAEAQSILRELAASSPADLGLAQELAELALAARDPQEAEKWEKQIQDLEGVEGTLWRAFRARRLLMLVDDLLRVTGDKANTVSDEAARLMDEAVRLVEYERVHRPSWAVGHFLRGMLSERQGLLFDRQGMQSEAKRKIDEASSAYERTLALGDRRAIVYERLTVLLYQQQRFDEAWKILSQLKEQVVTQSQNLSSIAISVSAAQGSLAISKSIQPEKAFGEAVGLAKNATKQRPDDPVAWIWLGQTELLAEHPDKAAAACQEAVKLAPEDVRTWNALFTFYLRTEQRDQAQETLTKLAEKAKLTESQRAFVLAQGYEMLGNPKEAERYYRTAKGLEPENIPIQRRLAALLLKTDPEEAKRELRRVLQLSPEENAARRTLSAVLAASGSDRDWLEAMELLNRPKAKPDEKIVDQRLQAVLLMRRGRPSDRDKSLEILESLVQTPQKTVFADRLLLANLYESNKKPQLARDQFEILVNRPLPDISHVSAYLDFLLRQNAREKLLPTDQQPLDWSNEIANWLQRLVELDPNSFSTLSMKVRVLNSQDRSDEKIKKIKALVEDFAKKSVKDETKRNDLEVAVGNLYSSVGLYEDATGHYKSALKSDPKLYDHLALNLAQQDKLNDAIAVCETAAKNDDTSKPATVLAQALTRGHPSAQDFNRAEAVFAEALEQHGKDLNYLLALTGVRFIQGRTDQVEKLSRRILEIEPTHVVAMNNLASLLAESEKPESQAEALKLVDRARELTNNNNVVLLDTKGMLLFYQGKTEPARQLLEEAVKVTPVDPRYLFHLAVVYGRMNRADDARKFLSQAQSAGLPPELLTPKERSLLKDLDQRLGKANTGKDAALNPRDNR